MASNHLIQDPQTTERLELRALRKMARALCEHTRQLVAAARARNALQSREDLLQLQVFAERRVQVLQLLLASRDGLDEARATRLEKLIAAISLSRVYFMNLQHEATEIRIPARVFRVEQSGGTNG